MLVFTSFPHFCTLTVWLFVRTLLNYSRSFAFDERKISICRDRVKTTSTTTTAQPKIRSQRSSVLLQTRTGDNQKCSGVFRCQKYSIINALETLINALSTLSPFSSISVSARILSTSSHATVDLTATMLMWQMTARWALTWKIWHIINFSSQLFHICYPVAYPDGQEEMFKWSFICPNQTIFDQVNFHIFAIAQTRPSLTRLTFIFL